MMTDPDRVSIRNLLEDLPDGRGEEVFETIIAQSNLRIERIVSTGQCSPDGYWYDQPQHEFVVLISGAAKLRFEHDPAPIDLRPGDYLNIPANRRHRVEWTSPDKTTVWLVIHYDAD